MKTYAKLQNGQVIEYGLSEQAIRVRYPNTSLPTPFIPPEDYVSVVAMPQPEFNSVIQVAREVAPLLQDGQWMQQWQVSSKFTEIKVDPSTSRPFRGPRFMQDESTLVTLTVQEQEQQAMERHAQQQAVKARDKRTQLLAETDWTQMRDIPEAVSQAWMDYRQALRDVPDQEGFPMNIQWPQKPE